VQEECPSRGLEKGESRFQSKKGKIEIWATWLFPERKKNDSHVFIGVSDDAAVLSRGDRRREEEEEEKEEGGGGQDRIGGCGGFNDVFLLD